MSTPFLAEIRLFSFGFPPKGWAFCNGQILAIAQNQALFSILGTTYGGNGVTTFALPNLQGRTPLHTSSSFVLGQVGGEAAHTLITSEIPAHNHLPQGTTTTAAAGTPAGNTWAASDQLPYSPSAPNVALDPNSIAPAGANQPHNNLQPYLVLSFCIALQGIFPSRN